MTELPDIDIHRSPFLSRRRAPRIQTGATVRIRAISAAGPDVFAVHDIGFRGFAIVTSEPVAVRTRICFAFSSSRTPAFTADAVSIHCHEDQSTPGFWISGWEFPEQPGLDTAIDKLVDAAVGAVSID
jgi:hypothetical protein